MLVKGFVFSGVMRGRPLVGIYYDRISGAIGYKPFKGTLDIKLDQKVDLSKLSNKPIEHLLMDGQKIVNLRLAPIKLTVKGQTLSCWCMQQEGGIYQKDIIEVLAQDRLKDSMKIEDMQAVEVEFMELPAKKEKPSIILKIMNRFQKKQGSNKA